MVTDLMLWHIFLVIRKEFQEMVIIIDVVSYFLFFGY